MSGVWNGANAPDEPIGSVSDDLGEGQCPGTGLLLKVGGNDRRKFRGAIFAPQPGHDPTQADPVFSPRRFMCGVDVRLPYFGLFPSQQHKGRHIQGTRTSDC